MSRQTGRITVDLGGSNVLTSKEGASLTIGGTKRVQAMSDNGVHYYKEEIIPSMVEATLVHMADSDVVAMQKLKGLGLTFNTDTGVSFIITPAIFLEYGTLQNGELSVKFGGPPAEKV